MIYQAAKFLLLAALCEGAGRASAAQLLVSANATDSFYSIGHAANGDVVFAGSRQDQAGYFTYNDVNGFSFTGLGALLNGGVAVAQRITSDGTRIVGYSESASTDVGYEATLWNVSSPNSPVGLGFLGGNLKDSLGYGIGIQGGSTIVVGASSSAGSTTGFKWTSSGGMTSLPLTGLPSVTSIATGVSANGDVWTGNEDPSGPNNFRAVVGNSSGVSALDSLGSQFTVANDISRDGTVVVGNIGQQAAFWSGSTYTATLITLNGASLLGTAIAADGGFIVGRADDGFGWIADSSGIAHRIGDWLLDVYGIDLDHSTTSVNDIFVEGGKIDLALQLSDGAAFFTSPLPAPAPRLAFALLPPNQIQLRWPTNQVCTVEAKLELSSDWTPLTNAVPTQTNGQFTLTLPVTNTASFFRLRCP